MKTIKVSNKVTRCSSGNKTEQLKNDVSLFSKLYIASQVRESDINKFFEHENHKFPISFSSSGTLRDSHKSDLLSFIEKYDTDTERHVGANGVMIIDGPFLLHTRQPGKLVTFGT